MIEKYDKKGKLNIPSVCQDDDYQTLARLIIGKQNITGSVQREDGNKIFSFLNHCNSFDDRMDIDNITSNKAKVMLKDIAKLEQYIKSVKPVLMAISSKGTAEKQYNNRKSIHKD